MPLPPNAQFILSTLGLSLLIGPTFVLRDANSELRIEGASLVTLGLIIYIIMRARMISKTLKQLGGHFVRIPRREALPFDGIWIAIIPSLIGYKAEGECIMSIKGKMLPSWEFAWGMSPALPYAAIALVVAICVYKLHHTVTRIGTVA